MTSVHLLDLRSNAVSLLGAQAQTDRAEIGKDPRFATSPLRTAGQRVGIAKAAGLPLNEYRMSGCHPSRRLARLPTGGTLARCRDLCPWTTGLCCREERAAC